MPRISVLLAAVALTLSGLLGAPADAADTGAIQGRATDPVGGPLGGVTVTAYGAGTGFAQSTVTASDGSFMVAGLPDGSYTVCFNALDATGGDSATGYVNTCWKDVDARDGASSDGVQLVDVSGGATTGGVVQALPRAGGVTGLVADAAGHPLAGAVVSADSGPGSPPSVRGTATTGADGRYTIDRLPPSSLYTVCVSATDVTGGDSTTGYLDQCYGHVLAQFGREPFGNAATFAVTGGATATPDTIELDAAGQISGTVTDVDGAPIAGIRVSGDSDTLGSVTATDVTDASGHFLLSVDNEGGGANGEFHGTRLPAVPFRLYFSAFDVPGFVDGYYQDDLAPYGTGWGAATPVTPTAGTPTVLTDHLARAGSIGGVVSDTSGVELSGVEVTVTHDGSTVVDTTTDAQGAYHVAKLPQADYSVCFRASNAQGGTSPAGYVDGCSGGTPLSAPQVVSLGDGQNRTINTHLAKGAGISGRVTGPAWQGLHFASVTLYRGDTAQLYDSVSTGSDGSYAFRQLPAGQYRVCFQVYSPSAWSGCYDRLPAGSPASATPVTATAGAITTGIDGWVNPNPDVTPPTATLTAPRSLFTAERIIRLGVETADSESGVAGYDVGYRYADWDDPAPWRQVDPAAWQGRTGPAPSLTGTPGRTYCFRARAHDRYGNTSDQSAERCTSTPLDDRALTASRGDWTRTRSTSAYGGTLSRTSTYGARLTLRGARAHRVALVVTTCPTCGRIAVRVGGALVGTIGTRSATTHARVLRTLPAFGHHTGPITLELVQHHRRLAVDGIAVTRL